MDKLRDLWNWMKDVRTWGPMIFWGLVVVLEFMGIERTQLVWSANVLLLVAMGLSVWVFSGGLTDHAFNNDETWEESWDKGNQVAVAIILLGRFIFAGMIASSIINPF